VSVSVIEPDRDEILYPTVLLAGRVIVRYRSLAI